MTEEINRRIENAIIQKSTFLDLSSCGLKYLPKELTNLKDLTYLTLRDNRELKDLSLLNTLDKLNILFLYNTQVADLSPLGKLKNLTTLNISNTQVHDLSALSALDNLTWLNFSNTRVRDLGPIAGLNNLITINASNTQIQDLGALSNLNHLTELDISRTQIRDLNSLSSLNNLVDLYVSDTKVNNIMALINLVNLTTVDISNTLVHDLNPLAHQIAKGVPIKWETYHYSKGIFVKACPLKNPPIEIVKQGTAAFKLYWKQIEAQNGTIELYEAKLIIVGEGGTGKTTLFEKLKNPDHKIGNTPETHGINIYEGLQFKHQHIGTNTFHANLWDFGGQDLQYMTHQFFLTPRALYVLIMDSRRESPNLAYWFKIISLLGRENEDSKEKVKLLLVFNKRSGTTGQPQYQDILKFYETSIDAHFLEVDFAINDYRFENLQKTIQEYLVNLPIIKSQLPRLWKDVREDLHIEAR